MYICYAQLLCDWFLHHSSPLWKIEWCFPFKTRRNVTQMLPSAYPCAHPYAAAIQRTSCIPPPPLAQPSSPLLSSPPLLPGCVSQDQRSIHRSSRWRSAGKTMKSDWHYCREEGAGKGGPSLSLKSSEQLVLSLLCGDVACVHQLYIASGRTISVWSLVCI